MTDPVDDTLEAWCEQHDTEKNRKALAEQMAQMAMAEIRGPLAGKVDHLAEWIETWLSGDRHAAALGEDPADIVAAMADVYPGVAQVAERLERHGAAEAARRIREKWDGWVPTLAQYRAGRKGEVPS